jgi:hypothetical protein
MVKQKHDNLAAALVAFQADLPEVRKGATGQVGQNRNYKYADLADVTDAAFPKLAEHGLAFISKPTLNANGVFVLAYSLLHESGGREDGEFVLPTEGTMQQLGSAVTYSRRYSLCAVTGIVPDEDDDGQSAAEYRARPPQQRSNGQRQRPSTNMPTVPERGDVVPESDPQDEPGDWQPSNATEARKWLNATLQENQWDPTIVANRYKAATGVALGAETDTAKIVGFRTSLFAVSDGELRKQPAANGAAR